MHFHLVTLFPELFSSALGTTMLLKGQERGALQFSLYNVRDYTRDKHRMTDDTPYGGGPGMVMKPDPLVAAIEATATATTRPRRVLLSPQGATFTQARAAQLAGGGDLALICGRYEGIDERVRAFVDEELSVGDYVLSGGEIAALVVVDAVARLVPGVLGCSESTLQESFSEPLLEGPQYTRPTEFRGMPVPEILVSGDHGAIARWRRQEALRRTLIDRPDLLERAHLTEEDRAFLATITSTKSGSRP